MTEISRVFFRVACGIPTLDLANPQKNASSILEIAREANERSVDVIAFPELSLTGYSVRDLLSDPTVLAATEQGLIHLCEGTATLSTAIIVGAPLRINRVLYNTAIVIHRGQILGIVPKSSLPRNGEFEETRWFQSGGDQVQKYWRWHGHEIPFGRDLVFEAEQESQIRFGVEICEDLWHVNAPSDDLYANGALAVFNLSASNFLVGKAERRRLLASAAAVRGRGAYAYVAAGPLESSTDLSFDADAFITELDEVLVSSTRFSREAQWIATDLDLRALQRARTKDQAHVDKVRHAYRTVYFSVSDQPWAPIRSFSHCPFVPLDASQRDRRNWEVFEIQSHGLATRMQRLGTPKLVLGISGGIDSSHAALVCAEALRLVGQPASDLVCIGMPGFGSTSRTQDNGALLAKALGAAYEAITIDALASLTLSETGHALFEHAENNTESILNALRARPELGDVTFENAQARVRTLILMTKANQLGGLVIGTGDLSEKALGWSTYAGDQIAMYDVNAGVPKTLIQHVMQWVADVRANHWGRSKAPALKRILKDIIETPISPELLPPDPTGEIGQITEGLLGPYVVHDFILFHFFVYGRPFDEILDLAFLAFSPQYDAETLKSCAETFVRRFFTQQFKRTATPDAPKVLEVALSPRGDWRMPSDISPELWLQRVSAWTPKS